MFETKAETVEGAIGMWAIPLENPDPGQYPFTYELYGTTTHWRSAAVFVCSVPVKATVPAGIDLLSMAHQTLDLKAESARRFYDEQMEQIAQDRKRLYLLAAPAPVQEEGVDLGDGATLLEPIDYNEED